MSNKTAIGLAALISTAALPFSVASWSAERVIEEVVVTGSYIRRAPEDAPSPVRVIGRNEMEAYGRPQLGDFIATLPSVVGSENVTAQEQSVGGAGASNINIRNLGLASTLILLDGKRLNVGTSVSNQSEQFVDINRIPSIMIDNIEILKDGASAIYGSDAVAGVANFKLRNRFEGFEITGMYQDGFRGKDTSFDRLGLPEMFRESVSARLDDEHSDLDVGVIWGFGNDRTHFVIGGNYFERDPLETLNRGFASDRVRDPTVGGPSPFNLPQDMFAATRIALGEGNFVDVPGTVLISDSSCTALASDRVRNSGLCSTKNDLLSRDIFSEETRKQLLATFTHDVNERVEIYGHFGGSENDVRINQSPSFPLTSQPTFSPNNPGFIFEVQNAFASLATTGQVPFGDDVANRLSSQLAGQPFPLPVLGFVPVAAGGFDVTDPAAVLAGVGQISFNGVMRPSLVHLEQVRGVPADLNGNGIVEPGETFRNRHQSTIDRETRVFTLGARGSLNDAWDFDASYGYSQEKSATHFYDTVTSRMSDALNGFFGVNCDRNAPGQVAGEGPCTWFNPFGSSILLPDTVVADGNGNLHTLGNDAFAVHQLEAQGLVSARTSLTVLDTVLSTPSLFDWALPGGGVGFALGLQYRKEKMSTGGNEIATDASFPFAFTGPSIPFSAQQEIVAAFTEFAFPITDDLEVQFALRYENYSGNTGDTLDPKLAVRWSATEDLVFRGSVGTSFRGPSLVQKFGTGTGLQFITPPSAEVLEANFGSPAQLFGSGVFARLPTFGNPDLGPEESINFNLGVIWSPLDTLTVSVDYWNYSYDDIIIGDDFAGLVNDCQIAWQFAGRPASLSDGAVTDAFLAIEPCNFRDVDRNPNTADILLDTQGNPLSVQRSFTNGTELDASGIDLLVRYEYPTAIGQFSATLDLSWFLEFDIQRAITPFDTRLNPGETVDLVGVSENVLIGRPLPEYKSTLLTEWARDAHYATLAINYVSNIKEPNSFPPGLRVRSHTTVDGSYSYLFPNNGLALTVGAVNLFDRDPPTASGFNAFESTIHDPRGRLWYLRARYTL
ncbi:MAG: TonB-dependent receptor plug domain-containing protein [Pseudomonadales bacterium]